MLLACVYRVMEALAKFGEHRKKLELLSAAPRATLTLLSCSPNFPRAFLTRYTHAKHEPIVNCYARKKTSVIDHIGIIRINWKKPVHK